jgi:hypothetical protein
MSLACDLSGKFKHSSNIYRGSVVYLQAKSLISHPWYALFSVSALSRIYELAYKHTEVGHIMAIDQINRVGRTHGEEQTFQSLREACITCINSTAKARQ